MTENPELSIKFEVGGDILKVSTAHFILSTDSFLN